MMEMFEGRCVDWSKFTAKDALTYTKEAQKYAQEKEYIDTIKGIAESATLGQSKITLTKKLTDYTVSRLETNGFNVFTNKQEWNAITTVSSEMKPVELWETTIKW